MKSWLRPWLVVSTTDQKVTIKAIYCNKIFAMPKSQVLKGLLRIHIGMSGVATSPVVLRCMCDSPRTGCAPKNNNIYVARTSNNRVIMACELYCCLLPRCEALRICRSGFPIATVVDWWSNQRRHITGDSIQIWHPQELPTFAALRPRIRLIALGRSFWETTRAKSLHDSF